MSDEKVYDSITFTKKVGCGSIYCIFMEEDHTFDRLMIRGDMSKESPCGEVWMNALARIITYSLRRGLWEDTFKEGVIDQLMKKSDKCYGYLPNKDHIQNCADAIGRCVLEYTKSRGWIDAQGQEEKETVQNT